MSQLLDIQVVDFGPGNQLSFSDNAEHVFLTLPPITLNPAGCKVGLWFYGYAQFTVAITNFIIRCRRGSTTGGVQFSQQYGTESTLTGNQNFAWNGMDQPFALASSQYVLTVQQPTGSPNYALNGGCLFAIAFF
jgi:hypothetical protein